MRYLLIIIILLHFSQLLEGQDISKLNGFKYGLIDEIIYEGNSIDDLEFKEQIANALTNLGMIPLYENDIVPDDLKKEPCRGIKIFTYFYRGGNGEIPAYFSKLNFVDCREKIALIIELRHQNSYEGALKKVLKKLSSFDYFYYSKLTPKRDFAEVEKIETTPDELLDYFKSNPLDPIEGVFKTSGYKIGIKKVGDLYKAIVIESEFPQWEIGDVKIIIEPSAIKEIYACKYYLNNKKAIEGIANLSENVLLKFDLGIEENIAFLKLFPSQSHSINSSEVAGGNWKGNGSGFFISEKGFIATNYHVIKDANEIQVEYYQKGIKQEYSAKIIATDKQNDLAILKINDSNFKTLSRIPYILNFNLKDVGAEVFTLGYPLEFIMGGEIKYTDGKISSKTGWQGDVTVYQITVPIQPGNSGGPLFDNLGNLIGITSSGIKPDVAQNVNYAIKTTYLKNLIDIVPEKIELPNDISIYDKSLTEKIKVLSDFIPIVRVK